MAKKILFVSNTSWSIYNFRKKLMKTLKEKGVNISFCANYDKYVEKLKKEGFKYIEVKIDRKGKNLFKDLKLIFDLYRIYKKEKPDLILHYTIRPNIYGSLAAKMGKIKCINTITGLGSVFIKNNILTKLVKFLYKISFKFSEKILFQNKDDLNIFLKNGFDQKEKLILVPGSGVDTKHFSPGFCEKKDNSSFVFLFLGRILWYKGVEEFVKASEIIKKRYSYSESLLLGPIDKENSSSISKKQIERWEKEEYIQYLKERDDVRKIICRSDVVVLPSYYKEGIPRSLLEAASMEKPIIATDVSGCKEVVENSVNGFLCRVKDHKDLADKMKKMINLKKEERIEMGKKGREKVKKEFDEKIVIEKYLKIINNVI